MTQYELADRLCAATEILAGIIREQAAVIAQADIPDETKDALARKRGIAEAEMELLEYEIRGL